MTNLAQIRRHLTGWNLDVMELTEKIKDNPLTLEQVYALEEELKLLHPENRTVKPKIRQTLQHLRNLGLINFEGEGIYSRAIIRQD